MKRILFLSFFVCSMLVAFGQVPAGDRIISMQVDVSELEDYDSGIARAKSMCVSVVHSAFSWGGMEPEPGQIGGDLFNLLDVVNFYYPANNLSIELNIPVLNTVVKDVPSDLADVDFDDPIMIERFEILLDSIFTHLSDVNIVALNIGNESDIILGIDEDKIQEFKTFFAAVKVYANDLYMELHDEPLDIGTTLTFEAFENEVMWPLYEDLNEAADIISVTYYGMTDGFQVKDPLEVFDDFQTLADRYPVDSKMIYMVEVGYPSSAVNGSSEAKQASFYENVFGAWDSYIDQFALVSIFKLTDWSQAEADAFGEFYGFPDNDGFTEFLRTLGIRTYEGEGEDKFAVESIKCAAGIRDFCDTGCATEVLEVSTEKKFKVFPNPSSDQVHVEGDPTSYDKVVLRDMLGTVVEEFGQSEILDISRIPSGIYLLQFSFQGNPSMDTVRLTIQ